MYLLETQLQHERFALSLLPESSEQTPQQINEEDRARARCIRAGLRAITSGLDNIHKDGTRRQHFSILWWQLLLCIHEGDELAELTFTDEWKRLNELCGLDRFLNEQRSELSGRAKAWQSAFQSAATEPGAPKNRRDRLLWMEEKTLCKVKPPTLEAAVVSNAGDLGTAQIHRHDAPETPSKKPRKSRAQATN
jgi:hypothetical protein